MFLGRPVLELQRERLRWGGSHQGTEHRELPVLPGPNGSLTR